MLTPRPFCPGALLLRLDVPSTDTNHGKELFENALQAKRKLWTPALHFSVEEKYFKNEAFRKRWTWNHDFPGPARVSLKHKCKIACYCYDFKFLCQSVNGKILMCLQNETSVSKFLRRVWTGTKYIILSLVYKMSIFCFEIRDMTKWLYKIRHL